jgi:hypothetical protein
MPSEVSERVEIVLIGGRRFLVDPRDRPGGVDAARAGAGWVRLRFRQG